jgi:hypothetical protein
MTSPDSFVIGNNHFRWLRLAALAAALAAIIPVAIGAGFWHTDAPGSDATCPICHVAHMPVLPGIAASVLIAPTVIARFVAAEKQAAHSLSSTLDSPPRAPPA